MSRSAPTKSTSGAGFPFETQVVAACLLDLLVEAPLPDCDGSRLREVSVQKLPDRWRCDDIVLRYHLESEEDLLIPTSVKSFPVLEDTSRSREFVAAAWADVVSKHRHPRAFRLGHDRIGLFCSPHSAKTSYTLNELVRKAKDQNQHFFRRVREPGHLDNADHWLDLFDYNPSAGPESVSQKDQQAFIASLEIRPFDLEYRSSESLRTLHERCRLATTEEDARSADNLWKRLNTVAERLRHAGGEICRPKLIQDLADGPSLKFCPRFAGALRRLFAESDLDLKRQKTLIGNAVHLERAGLVDRVIKAFNEEPIRAIVLVGPSGVGKSAVAAVAARSLQNSARVLWLPLRQLFSLADHRPITALQRGDSIQDLFTHVSTARAAIVLDGVDRATTIEQFAAIAFIVDAALNAGSSPWKLVMTCQDEHWPRVRRLLTEAQVNCVGWQVEQVPHLDKEDVRRVVAAAPQIARVVALPAMSRIARLPFVLDLLVRGCSTEPLGAEWVGESHLIEWFWESRVEGRAGTDGTIGLLDLGRRQADEEELDTALNHVSLSQASLASLIEAGVVHRRDDRLAFVHDTFGDWARFRWLRSQGPNLSQVLRERTPNPLWHKPIRLLAVHALESSDGSESWEKLAAECPEAVDFFLDGILLASDSESLLSKMASCLFADGASRAKRFVQRAPVLFSMANQQLLERAAKALPSPSPFLRMVSRDPRPFFFFWKSLFRFLAAYKEEVIQHLSYEASRVADMWLEMTPPGYPLRDVAADLALSVAEHVHNARLEYERDDADKTSTSIYISALRAFEDSPLRAESLFLRAASLTLPEPIRSIRHGYDLPGDELPASVLDPNGRSRRVPDPWPGGPIIVADEAFRDACCSRDALVPLFLNRPELARRLLLALVIDVRRAEDAEWARYDTLDAHNCGLIRRRSVFNCPSYVDEPYLQFLEFAPDEAITLIVAIANFASERSAALARKKGHSQASVSRLSGDVTWLGDELGLSWNRAHLAACPTAVPPLVSLEKFLGDKLSAGEQIDGYLLRLLTECRSLAVCGVLLDVGRRHPALFEGPLRPLLRSPLILLWSEALSSGANMPLLGSITMNYGEAFFEEHKAWLYAPYRRFSLIAQAQTLMSPDELRWTELASLSGVTEEVRNALPEERFAVLRILAVQRPPSWLVHATNQFERLQAIASSEQEDSVSEPTPERRLLDVANAICDLLNSGHELNAKQVMSVRREVMAIRSRRSKPRSAMEAFERYRIFALVVLAVVRCEQLLRNEGAWSRCISHLMKEMTDSDFFFFVHQNDELTWRGWWEHVSPIAIRLWAESPDDKSLRKWIAHLSVFATGASRAVVVAEAFKENARLQSETPRLLHLMLKSAAAWWEVSPEVAERHPSFTLDKWWKEALRSFVNKSLSSELPTLEALYLREPPLRIAHWRNEGGWEDENTYHRVPPLNRNNVIAAIVRGTPTLASARTVDELQQRLALVRLALDADVSELRAFDSSGRPIERLCDEEYPQNLGLTSTLDRVAQELTECSDESYAEQLWRPVIDIGVTAPRWVEYLIGKWLWPNLVPDQVHPICQGIWRSMIRHARSHPNWTFGNEARRTGGMKLWTTLLGVDESTYDLWRAVHKPCIDAAVEELTPVLQVIVGDPSVAGPVLRWISRGPGLAFAIQSLDWILANRERWEVRLSRDELLRSASAEFLDVVWTVSLSGGSRDSALRRSFNTVLRIVAQTGSDLAIDLEQRVSGRS
jgi:hypothetical protein